MASGLRSESRTAIAISGLPIGRVELLLAKIADELGFIAWSKTEGARQGEGRPQSLVAILTGTEPSREIITFASSSDFEASRKKIIKGAE